MRALATAAVAAAAILCAKLAERWLGRSAFGKAAQVALYDAYIFTFCHRGPCHADNGYPASQVAECPRWMRQFDWVLDHEANAATLDPRMRGPVFRWVVGYQHRAPGQRRARDPRTVYAGPHAVGQLLAAAEADFDGGRAAAANRTVVFGGADLPLSRSFGDTDAERRATVASLRRYFGRIFHVSKDIELEGVEAAPMGLDDRHYWAWDVVPEAALAAIAGARTDAAAKTEEGVLVAFKDTMFYCDLNIWTVEGWREGCRAAAASRRGALAWAKSERGAAAGVVMGGWTIEEYWRQLAKFRFLLSPKGIGVQSPKALEALLVLTIPIVPRAPAFEDLLRQGFPIVVVDDWSEITAERLASWWEELSPRLVSFRKNCLTAEGHFSRFIAGGAASCA